ncbi:MAG TPA: F0F1 ATP synthase subunit B [Defluviitoga tunisiensis]|jgi:F-type H+-transporting ATPase subunit b|uniref:ATP synthase subunit b n=1 Tax=Defluviitoga tunisiensis TaxID=1006576 RepID=A0A0C7NZT2_DEFTU|nr:F0F1 ATP synthase subunit B [Defluviitoga tunisiensis]CEP77525.1 ATP synthase subunit b [Defluviitoga tunisiensis]HOB55672.1 F0F1 ATP synthase subunit B [Defluviitoga tunisiensis]HOK15803.1 F0F1 ATP synthase subunit B [Defluviitoga tunisiensis]HOL85879.1 F0F1 ATP synthase subunit B [Defluviitoga tunisiensis]HOP34399.1 F0F1 ATP synthase subunit B [Defluviitoga tunisiensis]
MLSFNLTSIVNLVGFIFFMLLMYKLLYKPYFEITDKRKQEVEKNLSEAEKLRLEAQNKKNELDKQLQEIEEKRTQIILKAEEQAKLILKSAQEEAENQRKYIIDKAEKESEEIRTKALKELQSQIVAMALSISSMILKEQVDKQKNEEIIKRALRSLQGKGESQ